MEKISACLPVPVTMSSNHTILDAYSMAYLNFHLPKDLQTEWRLVFSNSVYGDSFTQLVSHMLNKGPSLLIIRDKTGHVFGGYASQKWELNSRFYGNVFMFIVAFT